MSIHAFCMSLNENVVHFPKFRMSKDLMWLHRVFAQCWRALQNIVFPEHFYVFAFLVHEKPSKGRCARFGLSFAVVKIIKMIFVIKLRLHEWRRSPVTIWLYF